MGLRIYPVILELLRQLTPVIHVLRTRSPALADQLERALVSVPLNVAEGSYSRGRNRQARFQSAAASARESLACVEAAQAMGYLRALDPETEGVKSGVKGKVVGCPSTSHRFSTPAWPVTLALTLNLKP